MKPLPSLDALAADPAQVAGLDTVQVSAVLARLAGLHASLAAQLVATHGSTVEPTAEDGEHFLTVDEAAAKLRKSTKWIYRHAKDWSFARHVGRGWLFSEKGLEKWLAQRKA